jgi:hypothetical protein
MRVGRDRTAGLELAQHHDPAGAFIFVQYHQLDSFVRAGLPDFVFGQCHVGKHASIEADCAGFASAELKNRKDYSLPAGMDFIFVCFLSRETDLILHS